MSALQIGLLVVDGITLDEVAPVRETFEEMGAQVTLIIPSGGSILPISGRYFPAAGGQGLRRSISQVSATDFDFLVLPDGMTTENLQKFPQILAFILGRSSETPVQPPMVFQVSFVQNLLARGVALQQLARPREAALSGSARGR